MSGQRRRAAAIVGIIACALAAIIVTAIIVVPDGRPGPGAAGAAPSPPALPKLKPMLLDLDEASGLAGEKLKVTIEGNSLGQPAGPDYAVDPAGCTSVAFWAQAVTYRNVSWLKARAVQYGGGVTVLSQSVVLTASPSLAETFLEEQGNAWQKCLGVKYRFGTYSASDYVVKDVEVLSGRIVAETQQSSPGAPRCQHVMTTKEAYVIEAASCGYPPIDANAVANEIASRISD